MEDFDHAEYLVFGKVSGILKAYNKIVEFRASCLANSICKISFLIIGKDQTSILVVDVKEIRVDKIVPLTAI